MAGYHRSHEYGDTHFMGARPSLTARRSGYQSSSRSRSPTPPLPLPTFRARRTPAYISNYGDTQPRYSKPHSHRLSSFCRRAAERIRNWRRPEYSSYYAGQPGPYYFTGPPQYPANDPRIGYQRNQSIPPVFQQGSGRDAQQARWQRRSEQYNVPQQTPPQQRQQNVEYIQHKTIHRGGNKKRIAKVEPPHRLRQSTSPLATPRTLQPFVEDDQSDQEEGYFNVGSQQGPTTSAHRPSNATTQRGRSPRLAHPPQQKARHVSPKGGLAASISSLVSPYKPSTTPMDQRATSPDRLPLSPERRSKHVQTAFVPGNQQQNQTNLYSRTGVPVISTPGSLPRSLSPDRQGRSLSRHSISPNLLPPKSASKPSALAWLYRYLEQLQIVELQSDCYFIQPADGTALDEDLEGHLSWLNAKAPYRDGRTAEERINAYIGLVNKKKGKKIPATVHSLGEYGRSGRTTRTPSPRAHPPGSQYDPFMFIPPEELARYKEERKYTPQPSASPKAGARRQPVWQSRSSIPSSSSSIQSRRRSPKAGETVPSQRGSSGSTEEIPRSPPRERSDLVREQVRIWNEIEQLFDHPF